MSARVMPCRRIQSKGAGPRPAAGRLRRTLGSSAPCRQHRSVVKAVPWVGAHCRCRTGAQEGSSCDPPTGPGPPVRDDPPRGTLTDEHHRLLALWAASCAEHVLELFESARPEDRRPGQAIEHARAWVRGEIGMMQARAAGGHAMGAARDLSGAARHAAYAAGQAGAVAHVAAHAGPVRS